MQDETRWSDLPAEPAVVDALDIAGSKDACHDQNSKRGWSEHFADACAVMFANSLRESSDLSRKRILPNSDGTGREPITPLGSGTKKRIDVVVADHILGLEVGVSLKGLNFADGGSGNFDKNLTGRLYELSDEMRLVHEHLPHAYMVGVFFLPLAATTDKTHRAPSSVAHTAMKLRERTTRLDWSLAGQASRCDASFVAIYNDATDTDVERGALRFCDTSQPIPRRGRPQITRTLTLTQVTEAIVRGASAENEVEWDQPEQDSSTETENS